MTNATPHPAWCQPTHCTTGDFNITHKHLIGSIAAVQVWVQRTDSTTPNRDHMYGLTAVHLLAPGGPVSGHLDILRDLLHAAEGFANAVQGVR